MNNETHKKAQQAAEMLGEYFDSVLILCTVAADDEAQMTDYIAAGSGSVMTRTRAAQEYVMHQDEIVRHLARKRLEGEMD